MKRYMIILGVLFNLTGCFVNERGISNRYYDDCKEYYDASGTYYKECPKNWIDAPMTPESFSH
ncbi:hypothetical protein ACV014_000077 [Campylobacter upsaliensis]|nr:hypothetical protein [Campylobacter upsaliensis]EAL3987311.1 hypothetical protein [Campylobacter upsaliensis]EGL3838579.1 hypothetical protein [Campylobacter upsaliensis]EHJ4416186.1 hypothetical protein [Campylobacter upsaliensis]